MTENLTRIRVLCVDDHPIVRHGVTTLLCTEPDMAVVAEAANGQEAVRQFRAHRPDVTLMDLRMSGMVGLDAIGAIRAEFADARIIVLTTYADDALTQRALQAGARGYLLKSALHKELLDAIRAVHAGCKVLPSERSYALAGQVPNESLTPAEIGVLRFIAQGNAYQEVARALGLSEESVERQVRDILSKLDPQDHAHAALAELHRGMIQTERDARHAAEAANRAKSEFLASMSHELRTPLNAVLGYAQLLMMDGGLSARQARGLDVIHQSGQHLLALINDILDLARIEAGRTELNPQPVNLANFLQTAVNLMQVKAHEKRLAFVFDAGEGLPQAVLADERRLRQVLLNLLGNAIKFTDHGSVTLHARAEPKGPAQALLRLDVEDTGVGMRPDDLERIFQPFEQVGDAGRRSGGTGLGLAITRALVNDMGGLPGGAAVAGGAVRAGCPPAAAPRGALHGAAAARAGGRRRGGEPRAAVRISHPYWIRRGAGQRRRPDARDRAELPTGPDPDGLRDADGGRRGGHAPVATGCRSGRGARDRRLGLGHLRAPCRLLAGRCQRVPHQARVPGDASGPYRRTARSAMDGAGGRLRLSLSHSGSQCQPQWAHYMARRNHYLGATRPPYIACLPV
jgi:signal transduction histidine kinase